jgi:hypothetical protein
MRGMHECVISRVAAPGTRAANQPLSVFAPRRQVSITRLGAYTRVVLTTREAALPASPAPRWA